jgi:hypothetical protein
MPLPNILPICLKDVIAKYAAGKAMLAVYSIKLQLPIKAVTSISRNWSNSPKLKYADRPIHTK